LPESGVLIGESVFRGESKPVYVTDEDRRRHIYLIGQTGTGKSTLLVNMVASDIKEGKGLAIIDPHGELIESIGWRLLTRTASLLNPSWGWYRRKEPRT